MKTNVLIAVIIAVLLTSCTPKMPAQEIEVTNEVPTAVTEVTMTQELVATQAPTGTEAPTKTPSKTPLGCVTLVSPPDGAEIAAIGKVTFSWDPMKEATFYVLNIISPTGVTNSFNTQQTFREQYIEAFLAGGQYKWEVILQDRKRNEICRSELATFSKPASDVPQQPRDDDRKKK